MTPEDARSIAFPGAPRHRALAGRWALIGLLSAGAACTPADRDPGDGTGAVPPVPPAVTARAARADRLLPAAVEDSILVAERGLPVAIRIANWARRFAAADGVVYLFGPAPGGYVAQGALVADHAQDCVSLLYRATELARARDGTDAVAWALATRFAGASPVAVSDTTGRVDYDHPAHLDFSLDMIRSGWWGRDITAGFSGAVSDTAGSDRYAPGSFRYVPKAVLQDDELAEGDIAWFVLDAVHPSGRRLRRDYGLVIGHIGIVVRERGRVLLVHAASSDLEGWYAGGTVVTVPLAEYLARVEKFAGIVVTRF